MPLDPLGCLVLVVLDAPDREDLVDSLPLAQEVRFASGVPCELRRTAPARERGVDLLREVRDHHDHIGARRLVRRAVVDRRTLRENRLDLCDRRVVGHLRDLLELDSEQRVVPATDLPELVLDRHFRLVHRLPVSLGLSPVCHSLIRLVEPLLDRGEDRAALRMVSDVPGIRATPSRAPMNQRWKRADLSTRVLVMDLPSAGEIDDLAHFFFAPPSPGSGAGTILCSFSGFETFASTSPRIFTAARRALGSFGGIVNAIVP